MSETDIQPLPVDQPIQAQTKFWLQDPKVLLSKNKQDYIPSKTQTFNEKLNTITRLVVIAFVIGMFVEVKNILLLGVGAILLIVIYQRMYKPVTEPFTITPTYFSTNFEQTTVAPTYAEEWRIPPPTYDIQSNVYGPQDTTEHPNTIMNPVNYPYGQYLTNTNLLPSDEHAIRMLNPAGYTNAREYANSSFLRNDLARRDNSIRIFKKALARRFRYDTNDAFSPYNSY